LTRRVVHALETCRKDLAAAEQLVNELRESQRRRGGPPVHLNPLAERILRLTVLRAPGVTLDMITSSSKDRQVVKARSVALRVYMLATRQGYTQTARTFGLERTTVVKADARAARDRSLADTIAYLVEAVKGAQP
jgi:chromosomal replication initiation ATPase DnaA